MLNDVFLCGRKLLCRVFAVALFQGSLVFFFPLLFFLLFFITSFAYVFVFSGLFK